MAYGLTQSPLLVAATPSYFNTGTSIASLDITGDLTVEAWVKFTSMPADRATIVGKRLPTDAYGSYHLELLKNGANYDLRGVASLAGTATATVIFASWNPATGTWYHVALTRINASTTYELIIDGVSKQVTVTAGTVDSSTAALTIGRFGTGATALDFDGRVSLVRVWNAQRSAATINANKCVVFGAATANMQAEWSLDNVLTDSSGNASTLTNVGTAVFATDTPSVCAATAAASTYLMMGV